ncbi:MAG: extracellular solute-binding protein [Chloroflexi bacterium]|nr:MAG: extracellular solute-binding protein [Chloroflexota bacterium]
MEYFSGWNEGEPYVPLFREIIADFEAENPGIKVNATWNGRESLTKLRPMILAGTIPDITDHGADELFGALVKEGLTQPLNDYLDTEAIGQAMKWKDTFLPGQLELYQKEGEFHTIPFWLDTTGFYYNGKLFAEQGVQPANTWSEFMALCDTLKNNGVAPLVADGGIDFYNAYYFSHFVQRVLGTGALHAAAEDKTGARWDDPGYLQAAQMVRELLDKECFIDGFEGYQWPAGQVDFVQGAGAMLLCSTWIPAETKDSAPAGFEYRFFPPPLVEAGKGKITDAEIFQWAWVVLKDAKHKDEAVKFLKFWLQPKYVDRMATEYNAIMALRGAAVPPLNADATAFLGQATDTFRLYDGVSADFPEYWKTVFLPLDDQLLFGKLTPEEFIAEVKAESIEYWETH